MRFEVVVGLVVVMLAALLFGTRRMLLRIPRGLCTVELLGRQRIRGTVRVLWLGPIPWFEVTSAEPGHEGEVEGPFGHGAVFRLRAMTTEEKRWLEEDHGAHKRREEEMDRRERERVAERAQIMADAPKYTHSPCSRDGETRCEVPSEGLRCGVVRVALLHGAVRRNPVLRMAEKKARG